MKQIKRILAITLISCVIMTMSGCRYSDTLEQIIYNQYREGMIDITAPFEYAENELDNEQKSNDLNDIEQQEDSERATQESALGIVRDTDDADTEKGYKVTFSKENGETTAESDKSKISSDSDSKVKKTDAGGTPHSDENSQSVGNSSPSATEDTGKDGVTGLGGEDAVGDTDENTDKVVVDPAGDPVTLPKNIETVAAVGELASMLVVLGCEDMLVATDAQTAEKAKTISAFSGLGGAEALWEKDGLSGLSVDGFNRLMELKPDLIVEISGSSTFDNDQIAKLKANGSKYLAVPAMINVQNVETDILAFGQILGEDAENRAEAYVDWTDAVIKDIKKHTNGTNYTLYIDGWDSNANLSIRGYELETGCAVINGWLYEPTQSVSAFLSYASVTNASSLKKYSSSNKRGYFIPMETLSGISDSFNITGGTLASFTYSRIYCWTRPEEKIALPYELGAGTAYQYVLAADQATAAGIEASKAKENGIWSVFSETVQTETFTYPGYVLGDIMMKSSIAQNGTYDVLVNPAGYASWTQGGCEGILETVWAAYRIAGAIDETTMKKYIKEFYSAFYDYDLTDTELADILEGN